jgi:fructose-1,6-bisphosphatase/inositol monophosphatase family enzyme
VDDLTLAAELVQQAGALAAGMLKEGLTTHYKTSVSDVVSAADHAAEELVVSRLAEERPDDGLVGEEGSKSPGERTWYIDPVDGTYNFLSGIPYWCSALALVDADGPVLGAVYYPSVDELWLGGRHHPTTCNGVEVPRLEDAPMSQISVSTHLQPAKIRDTERRERLLAALRPAATMRMLGSSSIDLSYVSGGRLGLFLQAQCLPWDWYPGVALVRAAGGVAEVVEQDGLRWHVAGNAQAVAEISEILSTPV